MYSKLKLNYCFLKKCFRSSVFHTHHCLFESNQTEVWLTQVSQHHSKRHLQSDLVLSSGGKNRELLLIDSTVDPTNSAQFHFLSSDTHLARRSCWTPLLMIDSLILGENSTLSNCSRQNVTTSFRVWPLLGEKSQEWVGEWWARLWKSKLGTSGNRRAFEDLGTVYKKKSHKRCCLILENLRMAKPVHPWIITLAVLYFNCHFVLNPHICANYSSYAV